MILENWRPIGVFLYTKPTSTLIFLVQATKLEDAFWWVKDPFKPLVDLSVRLLMGKAVRTNLARLMWALLVPARFAIDRAAIQAE